MSFAAVALKVNDLIRNRRIVASAWMIRQAERWHRFQARDDLWYDGEEVNFVGDFFRRRLTFLDGPKAAEPFLLHPIQVWIVGQFFGVKYNERTADPLKRPNCRMYRYLYWEAGKGMGKSPVGSGLAAMLHSEPRFAQPNGKIAIAAFDSKQAGIVFRDVVNHTRGKQHFDHLVPYGGNQAFKIINTDTNGEMVMLTRDSRNNIAGSRLAAALVDEVAGLQERDTLDQIEQGFKVQPEPIVIMTTNAGDNRKTPAYEFHELSQKVLVGEDEDDTLLPIICCVDDDDDPFEDESCWDKANPMRAVSVAPTYYADAVARAKKRPSTKSLVRRLYFGKWTEAAETWVTHEQWAALQDDEMRLEHFADAPCWIGLDLSRLHDLCAYVMLFQDGWDEESDKPNYAAFLRAFTMEDGLGMRMKRDRVPYELWAEQGHIILTPGKRINYHTIAAQLRKDLALMSFRGAAFDRRYWPDFKEACEAAGLELSRWMDHPQRGMINLMDRKKLCMNRSIDQLEDEIDEGRLVVEASPVFTNAALGTVFEYGANETRSFAKEEAVARIDPVVALAMATGLAKLLGAGVDLSAWSEAMLVE